MSSAALGKATASPHGLRDRAFVVSWMEYACDGYAADAVVEWSLPQAALRHWLRLLGVTAVQPRCGSYYPAAMAMDRVLSTIDTQLSTFIVARRSATMKVLPPM